MYLGSRHGTRPSGESSNCSMSTGRLIHGRIGMLLFLGSSIVKDTKEQPREQEETGKEGGKTGGETESFSKESGAKDVPGIFR